MIPDHCRLTESGLGDIYRSEYGTYLVFGGMNFEEQDYHFGDTCTNSRVCNSKTQDPRSPVETMDMPRCRISYKIWRPNIVLDMLASYVLPPSESKLDQPPASEVAPKKQVYAESQGLDSRCQYHSCRTPSASRERFIKIPMDIMPGVVGLANQPAGRSLSASGRNDAPVSQQNPTLCRVCYTTIP